MLEAMLPSWIKIFGLGLAPRMYTEHLIGKEACRRVEIKPVSGHGILKFFLFKVPEFFLKIYQIFKGVERHLHLNMHQYISQKVFQKMINHEFEQGVYFTVPVSLKELMNIDSKQ